MSVLPPRPSTFQYQSPRVVNKMDTSFDGTLDQVQYNPQYNDGQNSEQNFKHRIVNTEEKKLRTCVYCQYMDVRNNSGGRVATRHKCLACDVPLCSGTLTSRNCFKMYHEMMQL